MRRSALQLILRYRGRPLGTRVAGEGKLAPDVPLPLEAKQTRDGWVLVGPEGPVRPGDAGVTLKKGDLEAEVRVVPRRWLPRFSWADTDVVLPLIMLMVAVFSMQVVFVYQRACAEPATPSGGIEPSPEYIARLLREDYAGAEQGRIADRAERPKTGEKIEQFWLQPGHGGPLDHIGGGKNVGDEIRDGDPDEKAAEPEATPPPVEVAGLDSKDVEAVKAPTEKEADEPAEEEEPSVAVHVNEGWGLSDWYDTQDAREDAKEIERQLEMARQILRLDPDDPYGLSIRAYYEYLAMDFAAAKRTYDKFTRLYPDNPAGWNNLALVYKREGDYAKEEELYRLALSLAPNDDHALNNLAVCLAHQGRYDEALAIMKQLEVLTPDDPYADLHRAKIYAAMGKDERAYHFLRKSLTAMRKLDTLHNIEFRQDIRVDPALQHLRDEKRFSDLLDRFYGDQPKGWWKIK